MRAMVAKFFRDDNGQDLIEYALLAALIALAAIGSIQALGTTIAGNYDTINSGVAAAS